MWESSFINTIRWISNLLHGCTAAWQLFEFLQLAKHVRNYLEHCSEDVYEHDDDQVGH